MLEGVRAAAQQVDLSYPTPHLNNKVNESNKTNEIIKGSETFRIKENRIPGYKFE